MTDEEIEKIRSEANLLAVIARSVTLLRAGRTYVGMCPFHCNTDGFHVNAERGFYHCFACHASGDVVTFVRETEGKSFADALEFLVKNKNLRTPEIPEASWFKAVEEFAKWCKQKRRRKRRKHRPKARLLG